MDYKQYNQKELQNMFNKQNSEELNKTMGAIVVLSNDSKEANNMQLEEEIYQQMNLIRLEDLNSLPLEEIKRNLDNKI